LIPSDGFNIANDAYMEIPIDLSLSIPLFPYPLKNDIVLPEYIQSDYQLELMISEFFFNEVLYTLQKLSPISTTISDTFTTTTIKRLIGSDILNTWNRNMPCNITIDVV
jgi:hypothetical protein